MTLQKKSMNTFISLNNMSSSLETKELCSKWMVCPLFVPLGPGKPGSPPPPGSPLLPLSSSSTGSTGREGPGRPGAPRSPFKTQTL